MSGAAVQDDATELTFPPIPTRSVVSAKPVARDEKSEKLESSLRSHLEATAFEIVDEVGPPTREQSRITHVCCPVHDDTNPSLQVTEDETGHVKLFCESQGCKPKAIWSALGYNWPQGLVDDVYTYHNALGEPVFRKVRYAPWPTEKDGRKRFRLERCEEGEWFNKLDGLSDAQKNVPYHLPQLLDTFTRARKEPDKTLYVLVVEGEKCVRALETAGLTATTKYTGAKTGWPEELLAQFKTAPSNVKFITIGDADSVGRKQVRLACKALRSVGCNVSFLMTAPEYAQCDDGEDIADWIEAGHTRDELLALLETAPPAKDENLGSEPEGDALPEHVDEPWLDRLTDMVTGELFAERHGASIRWCEDQNAWLVWDGKRWKVGASSMLDSMAVETMCFLRDEAKELPPRMRKRRLREIDRYEAHGHLRHMIEQAKHRVVIESAMLDTQRHLINLQNGTLNLHTGELQEFRRENFITKIAPVNYDADAKCPKFDQWLSETFDDESLITYVQQLLGWSLEGDPGSRIIAFGFDNRGRTGKTTLLGKTVPAVIGDYAAAFSVELFSRSKYGSAEAAQPGLVALRGARYAYAAESKEHRLDLERVKQMTGGDAVTARALYSSPVTFTPECKFFVYGNRLPEIPDGDSAWWERVRVIPFTHQIGRQDLHFFERVLAPELDGIFAWLVRGHQALRANNYVLPDCEAVSAATRQYESQEDVLAQFLDTECDIRADVEALSKDLYARYKAWCEKNGHQSMSNRKFSTRLRERGLTNVTNLGPRQNANGFKGIALRGQAPTNQTAPREETEF